MDTERNFAHIERSVLADPERDSQNLQQFVSDSPWSAQAVIQRVQQEIAHAPGLTQGGVLLLDESVDEKANEENAGAGRQHNGGWER